MALHSGQLEQKVVDFLKYTDWVSTIDIANNLNDNRRHVYEALQRLYKRNFVYKKKYGNNCFWSLNFDEIQNIWKNNKKVKIVNKQLAPLDSNTIHSKILNAEILPEDPNLYFNIGKKTLPILLSFSGIPTSKAIINATIHSIDDSLSYYSKSNKIDYALCTGMKSFIMNYAKNYSIEYLQENMQNRTDDDIFNEVLEGAKLLSSTIIENI